MLLACLLSPFWILTSSQGSGQRLKSPATMAIQVSRRPPKLLYLMFPRTFLGERFGRHRQNEIQAVYLAGDGSFVVEVREFPPLPEITNPLSGHVLYSFDSSLRLTSVTFSDPLLQAHRRLVGEGYILPPLDSAYAQELKTAVQYWNGKTFVRFRDIAP